MFATDFAILLLAFLLLIPLPLGDAHGARFVRPGLLVALALALALHFALDHDRWQMVPAYVLAGFAALLALWRIRRRKVPQRRKWVRVTGVVMAVLALVFAALPPAAFPVYGLPEPSGSYKVGTRDIALTDSDRRDPFESDRPRTLMVRAFYPAPADATGERRSVLSDEGAREMSAALTGRRGTAAFLLNHVSKVRGFALTDAPLAPPDTGGFPVLIFSHGFSGYVGQNTAMLEDLASHGYLVLSIGHAGDAGAVEFPDGSVYPFKRTEMMELATDSRATDLAEAMTRESDPQAYHRTIAEIIELTEPADRAARIWARDHRFVTDQLLQTGLGFPLNRIDTARIARFGHSLGGAAAAQACLIGVRCDAAINLDGMQYGDLTRRDLDVPFLMLYSDHENQGMLFNDIMYRANPGEAGEAPLFFYVHEGAKHLDGSELALLLSPFFKSLLPDNPMVGTRPGSEIIATDTAIVRGFFDRYLKGEAGGVPQRAVRQRSRSPMAGPAA